MKVPFFKLCLEHDERVLSFAIRFEFKLRACNRGTVSNYADISAWIKTIRIEGFIDIGVDLSVNPIRCCRNDYRFKDVSKIEIQKIGSIR